MATPEEEKADPEISKLERDAIFEYLDQEKANLEAQRQSYESIGEVVTQPDPNDIRFTSPAFAELHAPQEYQIPEFTTEEGMKARGILDQEGNATQLGEDYILLEDRGLVKDGALTTKGEAFITSRDEIVDSSTWYDNGMRDEDLDEKKAEMLAIRDANKLDEEPSKPFLETFKELGEGAVGLVKGAYDIGGNLPPLALISAAVGQGESIDEKIAETAEFADKFIENSTIGSAKLGRFLGRGGVAISEATGLMSPEEADKYNKKRNLGLAYIEDAQKKLNSVEVASFVKAGGVVTDALDTNRNQYIEEFGAEEGEKKFQENLSGPGLVAGTIADPAGIAVGLATAGLGAGVNIIRTVRKANQAKRGIEIISHGRELNAARATVFANAAKLSDEAAAISGQLDDALRIGATEKATELTRRLDDLTAQSQAVQTRLGIIDDGIQNVSKTANQLEIGLDTAKTAGDAVRAVASGATRGLSNGAEKLGNGVAAVNGFLKKVERSVLRYRIPSLIATGLAIPFHQAIGVYMGARVGLIAAVPTLRRMSKFGNAVSEELLERSSSTPFFRRLAANESVGGIGRAVATLGDYSTPLVRGFASMAKGTAQAAPATFAYNAINSQGIDENTLKYAARDALVFGSLGRVIGGKKDMEQVNIDQMTNYRNKLDADQIAMFDGLKDRDFRYALSNIDAAYPKMFKWEINTTGNNKFDPVSNKAVVNINDKVGFLKEVAMHEAGHMIQHVWQKDSAIVARMLGDDTQQGLVRNPDGTLDPEFKAWADEYNNLREQNDMTPAALDELAVEYYTDQGVQTLLEDTLKGNLYKESRKTPLRRAVEGSFRTLFNATPIVKNLHFKMGGATDAGGRMVMGTGLLADGFRELPEVKAMVRQMYRETAGKPKAARVQKVVDVKSDNPKHYQATSVLDQVNKQIVERGEKLPNGVLIPDKNGNGEGILTDDHLKALEEAGVIDNGEFGKALLLQSEIEVPTKHGTLLVNKPIEQGRSEQFGGLTENYVVPTKWVLKKGRLYLESMDLRQLDKNVDRAVKNKIAKELNLTRKKIYEDIEKSVEIQNKGQSTDAYYESVDPKNWQRRKNFINSVLGQQTTRQLGINPMMKDVSPDLVTGIYRTFAFDRLQSAIKTTGDVVIPFGPTSYYSLRDNLMPQSPRFNRDGELIYENKEQKASRIPSKQGVLIDQQAAVQAQEGVAQRQGQGQEGQVRLMPQTKLDSDYMKAVESGDVESQQRMVDEAAKVAGYEKRWNFSENVGIDQNRGAFYTTSSKAAADSWGEGRSGQTRPVFILAKARAIEGKNILSSSFMTPEMASKLKSAGFDSASGGRDWKRGDEIAVFSPNQIKSADPITRDNSGAIIPLSKRFDVSSKNIRYMPKGKPKATRFASELAKRSKVPLSKVQGSGAGGAITPNDIRAYINQQEGKFKPLAFQKEPPMAVDPTISDLVGSEIEFQGRVGTIVDDGGRPVLQDTDGAVYELPFGYFTDQSSRQLGVRPTGKRVVDKNNLIKEFEETSRQELRDIFGYVDDMTDKIVDLAELGNSVKRSKNRKSEIVRETPEFQQYVRGVTDQQILQAWDRTEKALNRAKQSKNINNEDIKAIIDKLEGDIRNIEKLAEAIDVLKQQRVSRPSTGQEATTAVSGTSQADLMAQMEAEARAAGAKRRASSVGAPSRRLATPSISESYRRTGKEYRNPALARSISLAISGQSQERDRNK
jgi:hypothetical protein